MKKTKVLLVNFEVAGVGSSGLLATEALSQNPTIELHCLYDERSAPSPLLRKRLTNIPGLAVKTRSHRHLPLAYLRILFYCLKFRPDVVHDLAGSGYRKNLPLWIYWAATARLVLTEPTPSQDRHRGMLYRLSRQVAYRLGHRFVVFGSKSYHALRDCRVKADKIFQSRLGHKGFYLEAVTAPPRRDPHAILFFGEFRPAKGLDLLLPVANAVQRHCPEARFIVAGDRRGGASLRRFMVQAA